MRWLHSLQVWLKTTQLYYIMNNVTGRGGRVRAFIFIACVF